MQIGIAVGVTCFFVLGGIAGAAHAQDAPKGALTDLARRLAAQGAAPKSGDAPAGAPAAARFKPSGDHPMLDSIVNSLSTDDAQRSTLRQLLTQGGDALEAAMRKAGRPNDVSAAFVLFVSTQWSAATGKTVSDAASNALMAQTDALFDSPEMRATSDADKQRFYEYCTYLTVFTSTMQQAAQDDATKNNVRGAAAQLFRTLVPVDPQKVSIVAGRGLVLPGAAASTAPSASLSFSAPPGWQKQVEEGGAVYSRTIKTTNGDLTVSAVILLPAARTGAPAALCGRLFDDLLRPRLSGLPQDIRPEVFRRYVGNGLRCAFASVSRNYRKDSLDYLGTSQELHLYAVESGGAVVPVLVTLTGSDGMGPDGKYVNPHIRDEWVEEFLGALSGTPTNRSLFTGPELAGSYKLSQSTTGPQLYNAVTGAYAGFAFVSRGNEITLRADGTFEAQFVGVSGINSINRYYQEKGKGRFKIVKEGMANILVMTDSASGREFKERLAGAFVLPGGAGKMLITLPVNMPVTAVNIAQSCDRYRTTTATK